VEVSSNLPWFTAIAGVTARVNVKGQHSLSDFYFISMLKYVRITFSFWLEEKNFMKQKSRTVTVL
jgi:hypothetical protein